MGNPLRRSTGNGAPHAESETRDDLIDRGGRLDFFAFAIWVVSGNKDRDGREFGGWINKISGVPDVEQRGFGWAMWTGIFYLFYYFILVSYWVFYQGKLTGQLAECHVGKPHAGGVKLHRGIQLLTTPGHAS